MLVACRTRRRASLGVVAASCIGWASTSRRSRDRRDARLGQCAAVARGHRADPAGRRRDARRRPQVRGGHPARPRRTAERAARGVTTRQVDGRRLFGRAVGLVGVEVRPRGRPPGGDRLWPWRSSSTSAIGSRCAAPARPCSCAGKDDLEPHVTFDRYWRGRLDLGPRGCSPDPWEELVPSDADERRGAAARGRRAHGAGRGPDRDARARRPRRVGRGGRPRRAVDLAGRLQQARGPAASRVRPMTPAELRDAERLVDLLVPKLERRRTRRYELHPHGRRIAPRAMFRRNLATGARSRAGSGGGPSSAPDRWSSSATSRVRWSGIPACSCGSCRPCRLPRPSRRSRSCSGRGSRASRVSCGTAIATVLAKVADPVTDWAGGTWIGESFHEFNVKWARRTLRTSGVVIVVSDGWDRDDPALVVESARLRRNCHRLIWLNPLAGTAGYQPLAAGCVRRSRTSTISSPPARSRASSGWARSRGARAAEGEAAPCLAGPAVAAARERLRPDHHRHARRSAGRAEDHPASCHDPRRIRVRACDKPRRGARPPCPARGRRSSPAGRACSR